MNYQEQERLIREKANRNENATDGAAAGGVSNRPHNTPNAPKNQVRRTSDGYAPEAGQNLDFMSAKALQNADIPPVRFIVDEILPQGLGLITAPSKYGKSWQALDLCLSVAEGIPFLGFNVEKCGVLYLALEDSYRRLKTRMNAILKNRPAPDNFDCTTVAPTLDNGLSVNLRNYIKEHPTTGLIVIDVLQKVRSATRGNNPYAAEYADMTILKNMADEFNIAIVVLHHNRKMRDDSDPFNMISGTMALMGTSDTIWVLHREKRKDEKTTLSVTGRDVEANSYKITFGKDTCRQVLIGSVESLQTHAEEEEYSRDPVVTTIKALMAINPSGFSMNASELIAEVPKHSNKMYYGNANKLGIHLLQLAPKLMHYDGIAHKKDRRAHSFSAYDKDNVIMFPSGEQVSLAEEINNEDSPFE